MNDRYTRITVPLSKDEFEALRTAAQTDYRHPREQARYLLRSILLGESSAEMNNRRDAKALTRHNVTAVSGINP